MSNDHQDRSSRRLAKRGSAQILGSLALKPVIEAEVARSSKELPQERLLIHG